MSTSILRATERWRGGMIYFLVWLMSNLLTYKHCYVADLFCPLRQSTMKVQVNIDVKVSAPCSSRRMPPSSQRPLLPFPFQLTPIIALFWVMWSILSTATCTEKHGFNTLTLNPPPFLFLHDLRVHRQTATQLLLMVKASMEIPVQSSNACSLLAHLQQLRDGTLQAQPALLATVVQDATSTMQ